MMTTSGSSVLNGKTTTLIVPPARVRLPPYREPTDSQSYYARMDNPEERVYSQEGLIPQAWSNRPGFSYEWHSHPYEKVLVCVEGSITFHTHEGDVTLAPGDRLDLPIGTEHAATVGPDGVTCLEAAR